MKELRTSNLKVKFLGVTPVFKEGKEVLLNPQQVVSLSALTTFRGKSIKRLFAESKKKGENLNKKIEKILQKSSLRGHASIATTPALSLTYEGSKFLDSALTGIVFSSSLMASGRRTDTTTADIVYPESIFKNKKAKDIYYRASKKLIEKFNDFLAKGVIKDEASKLLQYGIYGTGIIHLSVESIIALKREYEKEKKWMPEEVGFLLKEIEKKLKGFGLDLLYATRLSAPRNTFPFPSIFKNPQNSNIVRELMTENYLKEGTKVISTDTLISQGLKDKIAQLKKKLSGRSSLERIKKDWFAALNFYQDIFRDYNAILRIRILSSIPWRVWGEKKRHRTVPMISESVYYCVKRAAVKFLKFKKQIESGKNINKSVREEIDSVFSIPPTIKNNKDLLAIYLKAALESFEGYLKLIKIGIPERDAASLIPRAVKIDVLQEYDLYNLLTGYFALRLCFTADEELRRKTWKEANEIKKILKNKGQGWLAEFIAPKCQLIGFCPEEKNCPYIKSFVKNYSEKFHQEMKEELKKRFKENFKKLGT